MHLVDLIGFWNKAKFLPVLWTVRVEKILPAAVATLTNNVHFLN